MLSNICPIPPITCKKYSYSRIWVGSQGTNEPTHNGTWRKAKAVGLTTSTCTCSAPQETESNSPPPCCRDTRFSHSKNSSDTEKLIPNHDYRYGPRQTADACSGQCCEGAFCSAPLERAPSLTCVTWTRLTQLPSTATWPLIWKRISSSLLLTPKVPQKWALQNNRALSTTTLVNQRRM